MCWGLRIGMLIGAGVCVIDRAESMDKPHREALLAAARKYAEKDGVQFIIASVDPWTAAPGEFRVEDASVEVGA